MIPLTTTSGLLSTLPAQEVRDPPVYPDLTEAFADTIRKIPESIAFLNNLERDIITKKLQADDVFTVLLNEMHSQVFSFGFKSIVPYTELIVKILQISGETENKWQELLKAFSRTIVYLNQMDCYQTFDGYITVYIQLASICGIKNTDESQQLWQKRIGLVGINIADEEGRSFDELTRHLDVIISLAYCSRFTVDNYGDVKSLREGYKLFERKVILQIAYLLKNVEMALGLVCETMVANRLDPIDEEDRALLAKLLNDDTIQYTIILRSLEYCHSKDALDWMLKSIFLTALSKKMTDVTFCTFEMLQRLIIAISLDPLNDEGRCFWEKESSLVEMIFELDYPQHVHCLPVAGCSYKLSIGRLDYQPKNSSSGSFELLKFILSKNDFSSKALNGVARYLLLSASLGLSAVSYDNMARFILLLGDLLKLKYVEPYTKVAIFGFISTAAKNRMEDPQGYYKLLDLIAEQFGIDHKCIDETQLFLTMLVKHSSHHTQCVLDSLECVLQLISIKHPLKERSPECLETRARLSLILASEVRNKWHVIKLLNTAFPPVGNKPLVQVENWQKQQLFKIYQSDYLSFTHLLKWIIKGEDLFILPSETLQELTEIILNKILSEKDLCLEQRGLFFKWLERQLQNPNFGEPSEYIKKLIYVVLHKKIHTFNLLPNYQRPSIDTVFSLTRAKEILAKEWKQMLPVVNVMQLDKQDIKRCYYIDWKIAAEETLHKIDIIFGLACMKSHLRTGKNGKYISRSIGKMFLRKAERLPLVELRQDMQNIIYYTQVKLRS